MAPILCASWIFAQHILRHPPSMLTISWVMHARGVLLLLPLLLNLVLSLHPRSLIVFPLDVSSKSIMKPERNSRLLYFDK